MRIDLWGQKPSFCIQRVTTKRSLRQTFPVLEPSSERTPPCTSLVEREDVPAPKSSCSTSAVRRPLRRSHIGHGCGFAGPSAH